MLRNDERWVVFMEAGIKWVPHYAPDMLDMRQLGSLLGSVVTTSAAVQFLNGGKEEAVSLDSVTYYPPSKPEFLVLLFSYANVKGADPGFKNIKTRKNRTEQKKLDEGVAASAHLLISLKQSARKKHSYFPALLEDVNGLGKTKIQQAITAMVAARQRFQFKDEDGTVRAASARFEMIGLDDENVTDDAAGGHISHFVLIREKKDRPPFDDDLAVCITREEMKLKPSEEMLADGKIKKWLSKLSLAAKKKGFDRVQLHYVRKDGKNRSITFGTHREDAEDFLIKRIDKIPLKTVVGQTHDAPCGELVSAMVGHLRKS